MAEGNVMIQVGKRGGLTLPKSLRKKYNIPGGDVLTLLDLGGTFVLIPKPRFNTWRNSIDLTSERGYFRA